MPRLRPEQARRIELPTQAARAEPTPAEIQRHKESRRTAILTGTAMLRVVEAVIESGESLEVDTGTHLVTITATKK